MEFIEHNTYFSVLVKIGKALSLLKDIKHIVKIAVSLISISINSCPDIIAFFIRYSKLKVQSI